MRGNLQVRFLGEGVAVMSLPYPTRVGVRGRDRPRSVQRLASAPGVRRYAGMSAGSRGWRTRESGQR